MFKPLENEVANQDRYSRQLQINSTFPWLVERSLGATINQEIPLNLRTIQQRLKQFSHTIKSCLVPKNGHIDIRNW